MLKIPDASSERLYRFTNRAGRVACTCGWQGCTRLEAKGYAPDVRVKNDLLPWLLNFCLVYIALCRFWNHGYLVRIRDQSVPNIWTSILMTSRFVLT